MKNIKLKILRFLKTVTSYLDTKFKILKNKHFKLTKPTVKKILSLSNLNINLNLKHSISSLFSAGFKYLQFSKHTLLNGKDTSDLVQVLRKGWVSTQVNCLFAMSLIKKTLIINFIRKYYNLICNSYFFIYLFLLALILFYVKFNSSVVRIKSGSEILKFFNVDNKFWFSNNNFGPYGEMFNTIINNLFDKFKFILEPLPVNYSNEILANQIHDLSILLFILSVLITVLLILLLFNILILINMDKIIKIFKNKFILFYLEWNKKVISIEVFLLGGSILYFMYTLSKGILFIATHPINF
uniref:Uncharacterized protein n=1 Tax=Pleurotus pulmonarius TaxID=28995 RepID=A0A2U8XDE9_PLEPU|nr:hypothetical protein [Pleurotus pulmonarius]